MMKYIPNLTTLTRIPLTLAVNYFVLVNWGDIMIPLVLTTIIFLTDFIDGKIARKCGTESRVGALLDVFADFFYIIVSYAILVQNGLLPAAGLFLIAFKLLEFLTTSMLLRSNPPDTVGTEKVLIFDPFGRIAALGFYIIPIVTYLSYCLLSGLYFFISFVVIYVVAILAATSTGLRIYRCVNNRRKTYQLFK